MFDFHPLRIVILSLPLLTPVTDCSLTDSSQKFQQLSPIAPRPFSPAEVCFFSKNPIAGFPFRMQNPPFGTLLQASLVLASCIDQADFSQDLLSTHGA